MISYKKRYKGDLTGVFDKKLDVQILEEKIEKLMSEDIDLYREGEEMAILILPMIEQRHSVYRGTS